MNYQLIANGMIITNLIHTSYQVIKNRDDYSDYLENQSSDDQTSLQEHCFGN